VQKGQDYGKGGDRIGIINNIKGPKPLRIKKHYKMRCKITATKQVVTCAITGLAFAGHYKNLFNHS
jgi:hypothetical protein